MKDVALTKEQKQFAENHHNLVFRFLRRYHLPTDDYYDIVVFGYLKAVRRYLTEPALQKYAFTTIAWSRMSTELYNHYRSLGCRKRNVQIISIHTTLHQNSLTLEDILPARNELMQQMEENLLLHELAKNISAHQMQMVRMKNIGYGIREIAQAKKISRNTVWSLFKRVHGIFLKLCKE